MKARLAASTDAATEDEMKNEESKSDRRRQCVNRATPACGPPGRTAPRFATRIVEFKKRSPRLQRLLRRLPAWITPNRITVFRALLTAPVIWLLAAGRYWPGFALGAFAMLLDFVDGALAEAKSLQSATGAFLDPLVDKIFVCGILLLLLLSGRLPAHCAIFVYPICFTAAALTLLRLYKMAKPRPDAAPPKIAASKSGKLKLLTETAALAMIVIGLAAGLEWPRFAGQLLLAPALVMGMRSFADQLTGRN